MRFLLPREIQTSIRGELIFGNYEDSKEPLPRADGDPPLIYY